ncbi:MAG: hypothetical protein J6N76_07575, partial [Lachnospiraceae bacterium]|nr:hypothetical protein [Lachnospiraceae bacterium]
MIISDQAIVTAYCDTMAALLTLGLLILNSRSKYMTADPGGRMFRILCIGVFISSIANGISYALHGQGLTLPQPILLIAPTIAELSVLITLFFWLIYVDYRIYSSVDRLRFGYRVFAIPVYIFIILSIINFFYPILFYMDENTNFAAKPLFYVMSVMQYFYGIFPVAVILKYYKNHGKLHFFHITPVAVPVTITALFTISTQYSARSFGFAIALIFLHFS